MDDRFVKQHVEHGGLYNHTDLFNDERGCGLQRLCKLLINSV